MELSMSGAAWLMIRAGMPVYWRPSGHLSGDWLVFDPGLADAVAALPAPAALLLGMFVNAPVSKRMGTIGESKDRADRASQGCRPGWTRCGGARPARPCSAQAC